MSVGGQVPILSGAEATRVDTRDVSEADTRGPRDAALLLRGTQQPGAPGGGQTRPPGTFLATSHHFIISKVKKVKADVTVCTANAEGSGRSPGRRPSPKRHPTFVTIPPSTQTRGGRESARSRRVQPAKKPGGRGRTAAGDAEAGAHGPCAARPRPAGARGGGRAASPAHSSSHPSRQRP